MISYIDMACILPTVTTFVCYAIALALGHVEHAWLPMISDCGAEAPEKYIFRLGLITSASLLAQASKVVRDFIERRARVTGRYAFKQRWCCLLGAKPETLFLRLAQIGSLGLAGCAAISEKEDNPIHSASAVVFFVCSITNMWILHNVLDDQGSDGEGPWKSWINNLRLGLAVCSTVDFLLFVYMNIAGIPIHPYQAICEWLGTFMILAYNWSFRLDFATSDGECDVFEASVLDTDAALRHRPPQYLVNGVATAGMPPPAYEMPQYGQDYAVQQERVPLFANAPMPAPHDGSWIIPH